MNEPSRLLLVKESVGKGDAKKEEVEVFKPLTGLTWFSAV